MSPERIQAYLRAVARRRYDSVSIPPFSLFFHPIDRLPAFNYAIPDRPVDGNLAAAFDALREEFRLRGRAPRFEFVEAFAPSLATSLAQNGFVQEACPCLMACPARRARAPVSVSGLTVKSFDAGASLADLKRFLLVQRRAFGIGNRERVSDTDGEWFRSTLGGGRGFLGSLDGAPAATAMFVNPLGGLAEIVGVATLDGLRRRGLGTAMTAVAVRAAFHAGSTAAILSAADERAGHVYEGVGFEAIGRMLAWITPPLPASASPRLLGSGPP